MSARKCEIAAATMFGICAMHPISIWAVLLMVVQPESQNFTESAISLTKYLFSSENTQRHLFALSAIEGIIFLLLSVLHVAKKELLVQHKKSRFVASVAISTIAGVMWPILIPALIVGVTLSYGSTRDT